MLCPFTVSRSGVEPPRAGCPLLTPRASTQEGQAQTWPGAQLYPPLPSSSVGSYLVGNYLVEGEGYLSPPSPCTPGRPAAQNQGRAGREGAALRTSSRLLGREVGSVLSESRPSLQQELARGPLLSSPDCGAAEQVRHHLCPRPAWKEARLPEIGVRAGAPHSPFQGGGGGRETLPAAGSEALRLSSSWRPPSCL